MPPTLRQYATTAITSLQAVPNMFVMGAMLGRPADQLKMPRPDAYDVQLWLHGHVHDSFDYRVGGCRVVANPAGYVLNRIVEASGTRFELENRNFDPKLVLNVE